MRESLPSIALRRPVTVVMVVLTVLGLGLIAYYRMPVEFLPKLDIPFLRCYIPYPGATPAQVENEVAIPAEGEFRTVSQLKRISSTSDMNGCDVSLLFDFDVDMNVATSEMRDRMERLKLELPDEIDQLWLRRFSSTSLPVMAFALAREGDKEEFSNLVEKVLHPKLMRIEGVADVTVYGEPDRDILVEFNQDVLRSLNLSLYQVVTALQKANLNVAVGQLADGDTKYYIRALDQFDDVEELRRIVVGGGNIRLGDVAEVGYRARKRESAFSIDGMSGVFVLIRKEAQANTIATCRALRREVDRIDADPLFRGTSVFMFMDQSEMIMSALDGLKRAGKWGGGLALLVLFLFLRRIRSTLVVAAAIPSSLVVAFVFMYFAGMTLNIVTMISMIIALGMLVDNSIVVIENIHRHEQMGASPKESARRGATEVGLAITAATMTTAVVFIPILYLETGEMSTYMRQFAAPVTVSLGASLLIALTVIPLASSRMHSRHLILETLGLAGDNAERTAWGRWGLRRTAGAGRLSARVNAPLAWLMRAYQNALRWTLRWRLAVLMMLAFIGLLTVAIPARLVGRQGMPKVDTREVQIQVTLDQNVDLERATTMFNMLSKMLDTQREALGIKNVFSHHTAEGGAFYIYLLGEDDIGSEEEFPFTTEQVRDILWQRMPSHIPGGELRFSIAEASESAQRGFMVRLRGDDARVLEQNARRFRDLLLTIPEVSEARLDTERDTDEIQLEINEVLAQAEGVTPLVIAQTVDFALRGTRLFHLRREGREIPVWVQFREEDRTSRSNLDKVGILSQEGDLVPLNRLVDYGKGRTPQAIRRVNGKNVITISAETVSEDMANVMRELKTLIESFQLPQGYDIQLGDELMELESNMSNFVTALVMAVVLIYLVMGALFESYLLPLSILTTVPLAFVGVYWVMFLWSTPMDTVSMIGIVLMVGIVVNNGIVIVDHINQLCKKGVARSDAIVQAGRDRFRPVMMTALTTILGCVPLALGSTVGTDVAFYSLGRALMGGLGVGTLLTLFVVPMFYTLVDDCRHWVRDYFGGLARMAGTTAGL